MGIIQTVQKWGNGTGVHLSKQVLEAAHLSQNQRVEVSVKRGYITLIPVPEDRPVSLKKILEGVSPEMVGGEMSWGEDLGAEAYV